MKIGFHKDIFKPSLLKSTAVFLVFVFAWSNMGIYQVVYAFESSGVQDTEPYTKENPPLSPFGKGGGKGDFRSQDLESIVKRIRERAEKAEGRVQQAGIESEKAGFGREKSELEQANVNIREQFKQTEARINGLPSVIQQRQKTFESRYETNLKQLKADLDSFNSAKTTSEFTARTRKLKAFLDKVKPPERHVKLNPNKLPHRMMKPVWRSPRTNYHTSSFLRKQESRETKDWIPHQVRNDNNKDGDINGMSLRGDENDEAISDTHRPHPNLPLRGEGTSEFPLLLGEDEGEVYSNNTPIQLASLTTNNLLSSAIVQTIPPPTAADLTSTTEVQFTPAILAKAQALGYNAVNIYNWVYNNIEYVPTYGSIQGADMCLQTMQCNDIDTASLLIALLRASNIPARYVYGTIQLPINQVMNWVGGFTDPKSALEFMAQGGVPITGEVAGGQIVAAKIEHVWVETYVNYFPSRGARNGPGNEWIPLDASYK
jgi:hypothetical protein